MISARDASASKNKKVLKVAKISHKLAKASKSCHKLSKHKLSKVFPVFKKCSLIMQQILPTPDSASLQQFNYDFRFWTPLCSHLESSYLMYLYLGFSENIPHVWSIIDTLYYSSLNILTVQMKVVQIGVFPPFHLI